VPVVLITISESENVVLPRPRFGTRAFLTAPAQAGTSAILSAFSARPSAAVPSTDLPLAARRAACAHALTGGAGQLTGQATNYMTRIIAASEGARGPHPAREPEPV
jgi:hypothetical protein